MNYGHRQSTRKSSPANGVTSRYLGKAAPGTAICMSTLDEVIRLVARPILHIPL